jgi:hypothetical protein
MTPLRQAFCDLMATCPGPDADTYRAWAASFEARDTLRLVDYVTDTIRAIERVGGEERCWLGTLKELLDELRGGHVRDSGTAALLVVRRRRALAEIRAREVIAVIEREPSNDKTVGIVADIIAGWE